MSSLDATDAASEAVRKGFRVTLADLKAKVEVVEYDQKDAPLTVCKIRTRDGWWLVGSSASVDPENFDAGHGRELAYADALRQLWPLEAYAWLVSQRD